jgi:hypothetical protein
MPTTVLQPAGPRRPHPRPGDRRRRVVRAISTVFIVAGGLMLVDAALTLVWQEPVTALQAKLRQNALHDDLAVLEREGPTRVEQRALSRLRTDHRRIAFLARSLRRRAPARRPTSSSSRAPSPPTCAAGPASTTRRRSPACPARRASPGTARRMARRSATSTGCGAATRSP